MERSQRHIKKRSGSRWVETGIPTVLLGLHALDAGAYTASHNIECFHPRFNNLIPEVVAELKKNNIEINTWTVNREEDINDLIDKKVDILIGNYPDLVKKIINIKNRG